MNYDTDRTPMKGCRRVITASHLWVLYNHRPFGSPSEPPGGLKFTSPYYCETVFWDAMFDRFVNKLDRSRMARLTRE